MMATPAPVPTGIEIPRIPVPVKNFIPYLDSHQDKKIGEIIEPFKVFESGLRKVYAQDPKNDAVTDPEINLVPIFAGYEKDIITRARSLDDESKEEKSRYIMELKSQDRKASGTPAVVSSFKEFQRNFNLFSEASLADLDWNNVVAAGSSVTTALIPVPEKWAGSKRSMRAYYHEHLAPASDVDLFLYGLNEKQALEKIMQIEKCIKDSILHEVTTIRTKNAITIASQYPTRHVQIVLRLYDSISQIITGFDVDCACVAYSGKQVYAAPRAIAAFITQCNTIDLTRRSPSYENRLSKYARRGFEVHWPALERNRIDPTIFERSFGRTLGLARLLILEKLPKSSDRDAYTDQRRAERGRPGLNRWRMNSNKMAGNIKDQEEDEVADWNEQEEVSSYHSMTVPYGPKYHAGKINRLLYAKDLLLNGEWNQPEDRQVYLHRHPCFFGTAEEVLQDCCGYCPVAKTDEELEVAREEAKTFVSGALTFISDDPGRQEIGSFNPITDDEWTTMAYVGDTARLCQAIIDGDLEHVQDWCKQEGVDVNRRDYTGRTPLHLATMTSTPEIVQCLIDNNARLVARLVDGRTALHLAAARGNTQMVEALMDRSLENEDEEEEKKENKREAMRAERKSQGLSTQNEEEDVDDASSEASDITLDSEDGSDTMTMGSFVKVDKEKSPDDGALEDTEDPDIYEIDVIAWDYGLSPLHLAILNGNLEAIKLLVTEYGADLSLPVKLINQDDKSFRGAIMAILLATFLPKEMAKKVVKLLIQLGATSAQGDANHVSVLHFLVSKNEVDILDVIFSNDKPAALSVINSLGSVRQWGNQSASPLTTSIENGHFEIGLKLLKLGAKPTIEFDDWIKHYLVREPHAANYNSTHNMAQYENLVTQPILLAANRYMGNFVEALVKFGADPGTLDHFGMAMVKQPINLRYHTGNSILDIVQAKLKILREYEDTTSQSYRFVPQKLEEEAFYTRGLENGTYKYWSALRDYRTKKRSNDSEWNYYKKFLQAEALEGVEEKRTAITEATKELERTEKLLIDGGAKSFYEMYPDIPKVSGYPPAQFSREKGEPYKTSFTFSIPDLNDVKRDGYLRLFQAAWDNDLDTVKAMTLAPWSSAQEAAANPPLKIAVHDENRFSPFSVAVLRGHWDLARRIIEICMAQYHKSDNKTHRQRWHISTSENGDDEDENMLPILSELVSDNFTIDNLGEVSNIVKSNIMPLTMMEWVCKPLKIPDTEEDEYCGSLLRQAVITDNLGLLKFLIELGEEQQALLAEEKDDRRCYSIDPQIFYTAIRYGRTTILAEMIKNTGVGIPLESLAQRSGVEVTIKPKHYQGLSVGGKKRADWAKAPGEYRNDAEEKISPLLRAAHLGSVESLEWFMSDAPLRRYREFAEKNKNDRRIKTLEESGNGFEKTIGTWLNERSGLVLSSAVVWDPFEEDKPKGIPLLRHIISVAPETLENQSAKGFTPLQLAVFKKSPDFASLLISAGANQHHRDKLGRNMIHSMVATYTVYNSAQTDAKQLQALIESFDKDAVKLMCLERCNIKPGALTPLALWMHKNMGNYKKTDFLEVLTRYSTKEELEMINGEGDLPLHVAIKHGLSSQTEFLLSLSPQLLYRENSTGKTPLEMARDVYISSCVENPITIFSHQNDIVQRQAKEFVVKEEELEESKKRTWEICERVDKQLGGGKRRLVSLFEANEVAKRVGMFAAKEERRGGRYGGRQAVVNAREDGLDIIDEWLGEAIF